MRTIGALALLMASTPAFAGWNLDARLGLSSAIDDQGVNPLQLNQYTAVSPVAIGPQLEIALNSDFGTRMSRNGLGIRQDLPAGLSVGAHALIVTLTGPGRHEVRSGLQGVVDWEIVELDNSGLGLQAFGGASPQGKEDPLWWGGAGFVWRFGS